MVVSCLSLGTIGMESFLVTIEADISQGFPAFEMVGLPDTAVKEVEIELEVQFITVVLSFRTKE